MPENTTKENQNTASAPNKEGFRNGNNRHGNRHGNYHGKNRHGNQGSGKSRAEANANNIDVSEALAEARESAAALAEPEKKAASERSSGQTEQFRSRQNQQPRREQNQNNRPQGGKPQGRPETARPDASRENAQNNAERDASRQASRDANRDSNRRDRNFKDRRRDNRKPENAPLTEEKLPDSVSADSIFAPSRKEDSFLGVSHDDDAIIDSMPPDPTLDAVFNEPEPVSEREDGVEIVGIHFPQAGKVYYFDPAGIKFEKGSFAIVETARGQELGEVAIANRKVAEEDIIQPLKPVIRQAVPEDLAHQEQNEKREAEALRLCAQKVLDHKLDMKLTGAQYTFDNAKLIFYFTAAQRVDFRELVKDLATTFRTRIELRQIGTRDEARMMGGLGVCGRKLCCSGFLPNYAQVSIKMAKKQGLALNSAKISGNCGRLMCCLRFEESTYERELAIMPTVDSIVDTPDGRGKVTDVRPVGYTVRVKLDEKADAAPKPYALADIKVIVRAAEKNDDDQDDKNDEN